MKVLFFSRYGTQYRYFKEIVSQTRMDSELVNTSNWTLPNLFLIPRLSHLNVKGLIKTHLKRKRTKYPLLELPVLGTLYYSFVYASAVYKTLKFLTIIKRKNADAVVVWNGHRLPSVLVAEAAKRLGAQPLYFENGLLPNTTVLDPKGVNYLNSVPRYPLFFQILEQNLGFQLEPKVENLSDPRLPKKYIFVPFQIDIDTQILMHSPWLKNMEAMYNEISRVKKHLGDIEIVIKAHPLCKIDRTNLYARAEKEGIKILNDVPTEQLIQNAEAVVTINSTVGMDALRYGQKVIVLGNAFYNQSGLTLSANSHKTLIKAIRKLPRFSPNKELLGKFLWYVKERYSIQGDWRKTEQRDDKHFVAIETRIFESLTGIESALEDERAAISRWLGQVALMN